MALIGGGLLWATQVPVHGHFWGSLAGPFFVVGAGGAFSFIPISIAGLAGIVEREAGLASGLLNPSQQLGGAIGVAIASTVAATHQKTLLSSGHAANAALAGGFQWAFWVCGILALLAVPLPPSFCAARGRTRSMAQYRPSSARSAAAWTDPNTTSADVLRGPSRPSARLELRRMDRDAVRRYGEWARGVHS
jgi:hypothetical protein